MGNYRLNYLVNVFGLYGYEKIHCISRRIKWFMDISTTQILLFDVVLVNMIQPQIFRFLWGQKVKNEFLLWFVIVC